MCAAPFGNGFFFSSWVTAQKARFVGLWYFIFLASTYASWQLLGNALGLLWRGSNGLVTALLGPVIQFAATFLLIPVAALIVLWVVALLAQGGSYGAERAMLTIPLVGWFYQKAFAPPTYYRLDTMHMFQSAVQSAMLEVINGLLTAKGLRALGDSEGQPISREFLLGGGERVGPRPAGTSQGMPTNSAAVKTEEEPALGGGVLLAMSRRNDSFTSDVGERGDVEDAVSEPDVRESVGAGRSPETDGGRGLS